MPRYRVEQRPAHVTWYTVIIDTEKDPNGDDPLEVGYTDGDWDWSVLPTIIFAGSAETEEEARALAREHSEGTF